MNTMNAIMTLLSMIPKDRGAYISPVAVAYNDPALQYLGRWVDTGSGMWTAWSGAQVVFNVTGSEYLIIEANTLDPDATALEACSVNIDNTSAYSVDSYWSTAPQITNGLKLTTTGLPSIAIHPINVKTSGYNSYVYNQTSKATITQFLISQQGIITSWAQGPSLIQCVGDSWMGSSNDWPRLMSTALYKLYPIATGGLTCADMNSQYNFDYAGHTNTTDPTADAVIVSFGVNDYNSGISLASFQTSMSALVDKIRAKQPLAPIHLIRIPNNIIAGYTFGQYGISMANVAAAKANCFYIDTEELDATIVWGPDPYHLGPSGKQTLADFVKARI